MSIRERELRELRAHVAGLTRRHYAPFHIESVIDPGTPEARSADGESTLAPGEFAIRGYAAVFDRQTTLYEEAGYVVRESIARGAFRKALDDHQDTVAVWDHDTRWLLGRVSNDTLRMKEDARGLNQYTKVAPTSYAADLRVLVDRRDLNAQSFAFTVRGDGDYWTQEEKDGMTIVTREIRAVDRLFDVSVVAQPAYPQTDLSLSRGSVWLPTFRTSPLDTPDPEDVGETFRTDIAEAIEALSDLVSDGYDLGSAASPVSDAIGALSGVLTGSRSTDTPDQNATPADEQTRSTDAPSGDEDTPEAREVSSEAVPEARSDTEADWSLEDRLASIDRRLRLS